MLRYWVLFDYFLEMKGIEERRKELRRSSSKITIAGVRFTAQGRPTVMRFTNFST